MNPQITNSKNPENEKINDRIEIQPRNEKFIQLQKLTHENSRMLPKPDERDLWSDILNDVSTASTNKDKKCLLVLGDEFVGKTAIISRLRRLEGHVTKAGLGLEYSYLDIRVSV